MLSFQSWKSSRTEKLRWISPCRKRRRPPLQCRKRVCFPLGKANRGKVAIRRKAPPVRKEAKSRPSALLKRVHLLPCPLLPPPGRRLRRRSIRPLRLRRSLRLLPQHLHLRLPRRLPLPPLLPQLLLPLPPSPLRRALLSLLRRRLPLSLPPPLHRRPRLPPLPAERCG